MEWMAGLRLVASNRSLWPLCLKPLLWALAAYAGFGLLAWALVVPRLSAWSGASGTTAWAGGILGSVLLALVWLFLFSYLFVVLASLFGGLIWERFSAAVEELAGGAPAAAPVSGFAVALDSLIRVMLAAAVGIAALIATLFTGPIAGWIAASLLCLLDYTAPAFARRGRLLGGQIGRVFKARSLGFALVAGALSLLPVANVLLWPVSVAGGTLLARKLEGSSAGMGR